MRLKCALASAAGFGLALVVLFAPSAQASVFINEILADPPAVGGDANGDGVVSSSGDEFVELYNDSDQAVNITGWQIFDAAQVRHTVADQAWIDPHGFWVVFGGLSLNNTGDTVWVYDRGGAFVDTVSFREEGGRDQSLTRLIQGEAGPMALHTQLDPDARFSPGAFAGEGKASSHAVPETPVWAALLTGLTGILFSRKGFARA